MLTYPQVRRPQPIYILSEILTVRLTPKMILSKFQSPDDRVINPIKIKKSIEVNNEELIKYLLIYWILNGFIDEDYSQITHRDYVEIIFYLILSIMTISVSLDLIYHEIIRNS